MAGQGLNLSPAVTCFDRGLQIQITIVWVNARVQCATATAVLAISCQNIMIAITLLGLQKPMSQILLIFTVSSAI
jgi:hypothetical protein